jgi:hypothetical protein
LKKERFAIYRDTVVCGNGLRLSVQASTSHDCLPRDMDGPYTHVEVLVTIPEWIHDESAFHFDWVCQLSAGKFPATMKLLGSIEHSDIAFCTPAVNILEVIRENGGSTEGELPPIDFTPIDSSS